MAITETKIITRTSTEDLFFSESANTPVRAALREVTQPLMDAGKLSFTLSLSSDNLIQSFVSVYDNLETYSTVDTALSIALDFAFQEYADSHSFNASIPAGMQIYTQQGIEQEFTCTTTYTYGNDVLTAYPKFDLFINVIESSNNLISFTNTGTQLIAVHSYSDSDNFTRWHWNDYAFARSLHNAGVTRTIEYALV